MSISFDDSHYIMCTSLSLSLSLSIYIYIYIYIYILTVVYALTKSLFHVQDVTQSQSLNCVQLVWIQSFPSPKSVAIPRWKIPVGLLFTPCGWGRRRDGFIPFPRILVLSELQIASLYMCIPIYRSVSNYILESIFLYVCMDYHFYE